MELAYDIAELKRWLANIVSVGFVSSVDEKTGRVRVLLDGSQDPEDSTDLLPVMAKRAHNGDKDSWLPEAGEQVILLSLSDDVNNAIVIGSIPKTSDASGGKTFYKAFSDGTVIEYDKTRKALHVGVADGGTINISVSGGTAQLSAKSVTVTATEAMTLDAPKLTITGDTSIDKTLAVKGQASAASVATSSIAASSGGLKIGKVKGDIEADGDIKVGGISLTKHVHTSAKPGDPTSKAEAGV